MKTLAYVDQPGRRYRLVEVRPGARNVAEDRVERGTCVVKTRLLCSQLLFDDEVDRVFDSLASGAEVVSA